jgi:hypothetical protein
VSRKRDRSPGVRRPADRAAPAPVSRKKTGAQKWVTQRVRKSAVLAVRRFVGSAAASPK